MTTPLKVAEEVEEGGGGVEEVVVFRMQLRPCLSDAGGVIKAMYDALKNSKYHKMRGVRPVFKSHQVPHWNGWDGLLSVELTLVVPLGPQTFQRSPERHEYSEEEIKTLIEWMKTEGWKDDLIEKEVAHMKQYGLPRNKKRAFTAMSEEFNVDDILDYR